MRYYYGKKEIAPSTVLSSSVILTIPENLERPALYLQTTSGNIHIKNLHNSNLVIESKSGNVYSMDTSTDYISAKWDSGNITVTNITSTGDIELCSYLSSVSSQLAYSDDSQYSVEIHTEPILTLW